MLFLNGFDITLEGADHDVDVRRFNPRDALNQYNRIADAILSLDEYPARYPLFEFEPEHSQGIHRMIVNNYVVCYVMDSDKVTITDILYGASDIHSKLENRHLSNDR